MKLNAAYAPRVDIVDVVNDQIGDCRPEGIRKNWEKIIMKLYVIIINIEASLHKATIKMNIS